MHLLQFSILLIYCPPPTSQLQSNVSTFISTSGTFWTESVGPSYKPLRHSLLPSPSPVSSFIILSCKMFPLQHQISSLLSSPKTLLPPSPPVNQLPPKYVTPQQPFSLNHIVHHPPYLQDLMNNLASLLLTLLSPLLSPSNPAH